MLSLLQSCHDLHDTDSRLNLSSAYRGTIPSLHAALWEILYWSYICWNIFLIARFGVGQNLYIYKQTLKAPANDWTAAVTDWYDEVALFRNRDVQPFAFSTATGHYTQVVWSTTDKVSSSRCKDNLRGDFKY